MDEKRIALFEVKAVAGTKDGEFEAVLSVPVVDRDGEIVDAGAFDPLPTEIPIHKFHDFSAPVATAQPYYDGDVLKARGTFDPDAESQAIRSKVGKSIRYMSVGFMAASRTEVDGVPHITRAELLEASFVSVPSNREAAILAVKGHQPADTGTALALKAIAERLESIEAAIAAATSPAPAESAPVAAAPVVAAAGAGSAEVALARLRADLLLID